jgi:recombinational DNA repair ATPase RecF
MAGGFPPGRDATLGTVPLIGQQQNPFGPDTDYSAWYTGSLQIPAAGRYYFATISDEGSTVRIDGKPAPQLALARLLRVLWLVPAMDRLWIEAAEGRRRFLDRLTLSFAPDHAEAVLAYEKAMRDRNRLLKDQVSDPHWYTALESQMAERILKSTMWVLESFNDVRNNKSLAHDNPILNYEESLLIFNHVAASIRFIKALELKIKQKAEAAKKASWEDDEVPF